MPNLAFVQLAGHIGRDAELRHTKNGQTVCSFSLAVTDRMSDSTTWFSCSLWGKRAESLVNHLTKGSGVIVAGKLTTREYETKGGEKRQSIEVSVSELEFDGSGKSEGGGHHAPSSGNQQAPVVDDDDIPF